MIAQKFHSLFEKLYQLNHLNPDYDFVLDIWLLFIPVNCTFKA